ncbi:MAG TPA: glycosyltransferase 87 family protein [Candidatus Didemnitutus sp.]|nr:glycosyltransferase 87 family protein [Candidatus Didemnitutus sp.]
MLSASLVCVLWAIATLAWAVCSLVLLRLSPSRRRSIIRWGYGGVAIVMLALSTRYDVLSDDAYRYRWDGWVVAHGVDPYSHAPADTALKDLGYVSGNGSSYPSVVPYGHLRTIYPPGAQVVLGAITLISKTDERVFKMIWWGIIVVLLLSILRMVREEHRALLLVVVSCPVVLLHGIMDIHLDVLMALLTAIAIILNGRDRPLLASIVLACAITVKFLPVLAIPILLYGRSWKQRLLILGVLGGVVALIYAPFISMSVFGSLSTFAEKWQSNSALYSLLSAFMNDGTVRIVMAGMGLAGVIKIWWLYRTDPAVAATMSVIVLLLCSPVVHPWYLILPLVMFPFAPLRSTLVWGCTMCIYGLAYTHYKGDGVWIDHPIALVCEFVPVVIALALDVQRGPLLFRDEHRVNLAGVA